MPPWNDAPSVHVVTRSLPGALQRAPLGRLYVPPLGILPLQLAADHIQTIARNLRC